MSERIRNIILTTPEGEPVLSREIFLKRETVGRFCREWANRSREEPFTMRARVKNEEEDVIEVCEGASPEVGSAIEEMMLAYGEVILDHEMERDLRVED